MVRILLMENAPLLGLLSLPLDNLHVPLILLQRTKLLRLYLTIQLELADHGIFSQSKLFFLFVMVEML